MKKSLLLILILCALVYTAEAQTHLRSGYIVTLSGDTINGYIDINEWTMNPSKVHFKESGSDEGKFYDPYDIRLFAIGPDVYEGGFVDVELTSREPTNYSTDPKLIIEKQLVFLQQLIKGDKPLYVNGNALYDQFYIKSDSGFQLLEYKIYLKRVESLPGKYEDIVVENKRFQGQLIVYLSGCKDIARNISKIKYEEESLKKIFIRYYECTNENYTSNNYEILKPERNVAFKFGITTGVAYSGVDFEVVNFEKSDRTNFTKIPLGVSLDISRPITRPEWSLYNELSLTGTFNLSKTEIDESPSNNLKTVTSYSFNSYKLINVVRYKFHPERKLSYFVNLGIANEIFKGKWSRNTKGKILLEDINSTEKENRNRKIIRGVIGAGIKYLDFSLEGRFETGNSLKKVGPVSSMMVSYTF